LQEDLNYFDRDSTWHGKFHPSCYCDRLGATGKSHAAVGDATDNSWPFQFGWLYFLFEKCCLSVEDF